MPNITGSLGLSKSFFDKASGAFTIGTQRCAGETDVHQYITYNDASFNASNSNPIYGSSTTVHPASYTVRYYIKAA